MTTTIAIACPKGGTGRTTLAVHIADRLAARGLRVLLRDADRQGSAIGWAYLADQVCAAENRPCLPFTVGRGGAATQYDVIVIDHGPVDEPAPDADIVVVPVSLDGVAQAVGLQLLARLRLREVEPIIVASKYRADRAEHRQALALDALTGAIIVRDRAALAGWYATGRTIYDEAHGRAHGVALARRDIDAVMSAIDARTPQPLDIFADIFPPKEAARG
jgi:chromosome partitioning protein